MKTSASDLSSIRARSVRSTTRVSWSMFSRQWFLTEWTLTLRTIGLRGGTLVSSAESLDKVVTDFSSVSKRIFVACANFFRVWLYKTNLNKDFKTIGFSCTWEINPFGNGNTADALWTWASESGGMGGLPPWILKFDGFLLIFQQKELLS